ncbi:UDP-3-O-(3-hydroxymyristoyl)glucosamine N-acyltransferase [Guyparkeria sp.]|uniref:UDP-3-O-(3-hydroxymyristoyl)glucosamine N-acyltransferase n=1 Tax=Guyparkeria sp. TaxID=2035736 RepID=UPI00397103F2
MSIQATSTATVAELAEVVGASVPADSQRVITGAASLASAGDRDVAYYDGDRKSAGTASNTGAGLVVTNETGQAQLPADVPALVVDEPRLVFARLLERLYPRQRPEPGIHETAVIAADAEVDPSARLGAHVTVGGGSRIAADVEVGPGCLIGENVSIGVGTRLIGRVTVLADTVIGARCVIQPGVVIGSDGFGLALDKGAWRRVPQVGRVVIGNDVDIGANTTIDRGALDDTVIDDGVKLDNLIQIAHNVRVGAHSAIAGCAGLAGSSVVGRHCTLGGGVGLAGHLTLADHVHVTGMSMVTRSIHRPGVYSAGTPLDTNERWHRNAARFKQLDRLARRVRQLEKLLGDTPTHEDDS